MERAAATTADPPLEEAISMHQSSPGLNDTTLGPFATGIRGRCPRCGKGKLFNGFLELAPKCTVCGLDYGFADPADGPAFFVICFACIPSVLFAVWLEVAFNVSVWVHVFVSLPVILVSCILPLRPLKGWLVASQYRHSAHEGQIVSSREGCCR